MRQEKDRRLEVYSYKVTNSDFLTEKENKIKEGQRVIRFSESLKIKSLGDIFFYLYSDSYLNQKGTYYVHSNNQVSRSGFKRSIIEGYLIAIHYFPNLNLIDYLKAFNALDSTNYLNISYCPNIRRVVAWIYQSKQGINCSLTRKKVNLKIKK